MNVIEQILESKVNSNPEGEIFKRQWYVAKEAVSKILSTISQYFPHFSLHDESHSIAILNNIVRIVGVDDLQKLSIVDLWMILIAAYYHDLGMSITHDDIASFLENNSKFIDYVRGIQQDETSPLFSYAKTFEIRDCKLYYKNEQLTTDNIDAHRFLIADFVRQQHATRSADKIIEARTLHLPGNPIPERIIKLVAKICDAHTQNRDELMKLPAKEVSGCGIEDCHPLYVACLLRIGDLLDVDSNRVSDVLLSTLASIPADSKAYNQTNRDITHIQIDPSVIEITAECEEYRVAELLNNWFKMINDEITFQTKEWYKISPYPKFHSLPAVGKLIVRLKDFDDITGKDRPRFQVDANKAIEMLQGSGLYSDPSQSIRELLQNSVDATYLRIFKEKKDCSESITKFKDYCSEYPISISITKTKAEEDSSIWHIEIEDMGLGMERSEMNFLTYTGSSSQNKKKKAIIDKMPKWMRPSGTFGIGFQSVFLITDKVIMRTRKWGQEETIELTMHNPSGAEKGNILSKTIIDDSIPFGTKLMFDVKLKTSSHWSINSSERVAINEISTYDFAIDESMDVTIAKLVDSVVKFAQIVDVKINLTYKDELIKFQRDPQNNDFDFYDEETGMQIAIGGGNAWGNDSNLYFRNQIVEKYNPNIGMLRFRVNLLTEDAKDVLELSRNDVRQQARGRIRTNMIKSICRFIIQNYKSFKIEDVDYRPQAAALLENYRYILEDAQIECNYPNDWSRLMFKTDQRDQSIRDLLKYDKIIFERSSYYEKIKFYLKDKVDADDTISEQFTRNSYEIIEFFKTRLASAFKGFSFTQDGIVLTKQEATTMIEKEAFSSFFEKYLQMGHSARYVIPCLDYYKELRIKNARNEWMFSGYGYIDYPIMVCPYIRKGGKNESIFFTKHNLIYKVNDKVIDYVYNNRYDETTTREQIEEAYKRFQKEFQSIIDDVNEKHNQRNKTK